MLQDLLSWIEEGSPAAIITLILVSLGLISLFFLPFILNARKGRQRAADLRQAAQNWLTTTGTVITSRVEVSGNAQTVTTPHIVYRYTVNGQEYESGQIVAGDSEKFYKHLPSKEAYTLVDKYPVNGAVSVYYDPVNPAVAALER